MYIQPQYLAHNCQSFANPFIGQQAPLYAQQPVATTYIPQPFAQQIPFAQPVLGNTLHSQQWTAYRTPAIPHYQAPIQQPVLGQFPLAQPVLNQAAALGNIPFATPILERTPFIDRIGFVEQAPLWNTQLQTPFVQHAALPYLNQVPVMAQPYTLAQPVQTQACAPQAQPLSQTAGVH